MAQTKPAVPPLAGAAGPAPAALPPKPLSKQQAFVNQVLPAALEASAATGIDVRLIIAQAALESGWGDHAPGFNYFGIKALPGQTSQSLGTNEYVNGVETHPNQNFRAFASPQDSFRA